MLLFSSQLLKIITHFNSLIKKGKKKHRILLSLLLNIWELKTTGVVFCQFLEVSQHIPV